VKWPTCALADDLGPSPDPELAPPGEPAARTEWNRLVTRQPPRRGPLPPMSVPLFPAGLTRAEMEQSDRSGSEPDRAVLYRHVRAAAAAARSEEEFLAGLEARGVLVRLRHSGCR
jgi:hypothetical protein